MKIFSVSESQTIDKETIKGGFPSILLMENAAMAVFLQVQKRLALGDTVTVVAGKGGNGGDGLAVARLLQVAGYEVTVFLCDKQENLQGDTLINLKILQALHIKVTVLSEYNYGFCVENMQDTKMVIDAMVGIGLRGKLSAHYENIIQIINKYSPFTLSVDMPSGIHGDTGKIESVAIEAQETVTFGFLKPGHLLYPGFVYAGETYVVDIGFLPSIMNTMPSRYQAFTLEEARNQLPKRQIRAHKGSQGKVFVLAGSTEMSGALLLSCKAAYKAGAGYVYGLSTPTATQSLRTFLPEAITVSAMKENLDLDFYSQIEDLIKPTDVLIIGPGLGNNLGTKSLVYKLIENAPCPMIIDADGLNIIAENLDILQAAKVPIIITPHMGEMSRLTGKSIATIQGETVAIARDFSVRYKVITVLKDASTIIATETGLIHINNTGNPALSKAGTGDTLTGIIGGILAQNNDPYLAARLGVYFHGRAGDLCRDEFGELGVLASDVVNYLFK